MNTDQTDYKAETKEAMTLLAGEPYPPMSVATWDASGALVSEKVYRTFAEHVWGYCDMIDAVKAGGYCLVEVGSRVQVVTELGQLLR